MPLDNLCFFFLMILIGYGAARSGLVSDKAPDVLPGVLLNICYPGMVLHTFTTTDAETLLTTGLPTAAATLAVTGVLFFSSLLVFRRSPVSRRAYWRFVTGIGNVSYAAIPLLSVFLPSEAMLLCVIHGAVQDFLIWSLYHPLFLGSSAKSRKELVRKTLTSPSLIAAVAGVLLAVFQVQLPSFLQSTVNTLNTMTSPLALLLLGTLICRYGALNWRRDRLAIQYALLKIVALPFALFWILRCFMDTEQAFLLAILFGSPAPLTGVVWCKEYGGDAELAVDCTICSTLMFLVVMSAVLLLGKTLGLVA